VPTLSPPRASDSHILDVLTFNTALLPELVASTRQADRVAVMASHLTGYDVLVLQELFVDAWRDRLLTELSSDYPHRTDIVGADGARGNPLRQDGGIVILSRWPILRQAQQAFGAVCSGTDCLADKGVAYAAVAKGEHVYHVFGTHAQSEYGFRVERVRAQQFSLMRAFVEEQAIPVDEPVLLAGDFNVDAATPELGDMLAALDATRPVTIGSLRQTWDPQRNLWARGPAQWIDYVLVAADHLVPAASWNRALALREGELDLSDHFAVWGRVALDLTDD
jgi:endonuclease/exonuclease/phosphatase family metal-dependent hydrolase